MWGRVKGIRNVRWGCDYKSSGLDGHHREDDIWAKISRKERNWPCRSIQGRSIPGRGKGLIQRARGGNSLEHSWTWLQDQCAWSRWRRRMIGDEVTEGGPPPKLPTQARRALSAIPRMEAFTLKGMRIHCKFLSWWVTCSDLDFRRIVLVTVLSRNNEGGGVEAHRLVNRLLQEKTQLAGVEVVRTCQILNMF